MSMMTGFVNSYKNRIQIKDFSGNVVATITRTSSKSNSKNKKLKRLQYNFKQISSQILNTKTSANARSVVTKARAKVVELLRKRKASDFDDKELEAAIIHAKKMERIARKRMKHLKEEENANQKATDFELESYQDENWELYDAFIENMDPESGSILNKEKTEQLLKKLQEMMEVSMEELTENTELQDFNEELMDFSLRDLSPQDLERLKKKHRCDELREIMEADMKYLKALFDKFEKEKQESANSAGSPDNASGVSLEIFGMEMPVDAVTQPAALETGTIDLSL